MVGQRGSSRLDGSIASMSRVAPPPLLALDGEPVLGDRAPRPVARGPDGPPGCGGGTRGAAATAATPARVGGVGRGLARAGQRHGCDVEVPVDEGDVEGAGQHAVALHVRGHARPGRSRRRCAGTRRVRARGKWSASRRHPPGPGAAKLVDGRACSHVLPLSSCDRTSRPRSLRPGRVDQCSHRPQRAVDRLVDVEALAVVQLDQRQRAVDQQQQRDQPLPSGDVGIDPVALEVVGEQRAAALSRAVRISRPAVEAIWWRSSGRLPAKSCHIARWNAARSSSPGRAVGSLRQRLTRRLGGRGGEQLVARREVPVDRRHRDAAALGHRRHRQLVERSLGRPARAPRQAPSAGSAPDVRPADS